MRPLPLTDVSGSASSAPAGREVPGACSLDCPDACSWLVGVEGGRAVRLRGNPDHPFTRGGLCAKLNPYLAYAADPDRVLHPLRRVGPKGSGGFQRTTWDDALGEIAARMRDALDTHGGEAIWPFPGTGSISVLQGEIGAGYRLWNVLGASEQMINICSVAGHAGMSYTCGSAMGMDPADLASSRTVVLWGTNTLTTNLHLWPFVTKAREAGATLVVIDPVRTRTAAQADLHLAPRPGTDAALALGLMARLVDLGAADEEFLDRRTLGWQRFRDEELAQWSVARAAGVCGIEPDDVERFARLLAEQRPVGIRTLMGVQRHGGGAAALRVMSCIPAVTGDYARVGGGLCYSTGPAYGWDVDALRRPDLRPDGRRGRRLVMTSMARTLAEHAPAAGGSGSDGDGGPPVTVLFVYGANPMMSNPDQEATRRALAREDLFTVVVDHVMSATAQYADIVLPGTTQLEHYDLTESYTHLYVQWNEPAVAPPGECLPHTEIFRRLAARLGLTEPALFDDDLTLAAAALGDHPHLAGISVESLRENGFQRLAVPSPYLPYEDRFPTPSGLFEFVSARGAADGAGELPGFTPPHEALRTGGTATPDAADGRDDAVPGALALVSAAAHYALNSIFVDWERLARRTGGPQVVVHPKDAADRGLADGDRVRVSNERGWFDAVLAVSDTVRPGVAASSKGVRPERPGAPTVNATTADRDSDLGTGATFHDNAVVLSKV